MSVVELHAITPQASSGRVSWASWRRQARMYQSYTYAYPHKTAYRSFTAPRPLEALWADEDTSALFLYVHVPFCEMRCGFCNLFTRVERASDPVDRYLDALARQAKALSEVLPKRSFARVAIGGGTPTHMSTAQLSRMLDLVDRFTGGVLDALPLLIETSPQTATDEKLALLKARRVHRVSMGVQSFDDDELKVLGRPSTGAAARAAIERIRRSGPPVLNLDLIYGGAGQTPAGFVRQIEHTLAYAPEEIFLYPLYVRPLTGLGNQGGSWDDERLACYRVGRDRLLDAGYDQFSMRLFRRKDAPTIEGPVYRCQEDGMVGLGCGARSYTRAVHYSDEWAVGKDNVRGLMDAWAARPAASFAAAWHGFELDAREQRRRWLLMSLLNVDGADQEAYRARFGSDVLADHPELEELVDDGLLDVGDGRDLKLTTAGLELSDCIGPWLWSAAVHERMRDYELR